MIGDFNEKTEKEGRYTPTISKNSKYEVTNENRTEERTRKRKSDLMKSVKTRMKRILRKGKLCYIICSHRVNRITEGRRKKYRYKKRK